MLLKPVFWDGKIVAFVANVAHMSEVGAKTPGGLSGDATEVYQEGLLLPPVKIKRRGEDVDDIWKIILSNHRTPRVTLGDFRAMMGSLDLAERRLHTLIGDYGLDFFQSASAELMAIAERRMRAEIEAIPDGVYTFTDAIEDDGITDRDYPIELRADDRRRRRDRRLHRLGGAGGRARQRDLRGHGLGDLQRVPAPDRPDDPAQRGLLPAVHDHRAARHDRELLVPGAGGGRQHRDEPAHHRHGLRRAAGRDPGADRGLVRRHLVAVPLRRHRPAHGRAVRALPLRGRGLGRPPRARREQHGRHDQRQLPQHAGRGLRDALPRLPHRVVPARAGLRRPRRVPRRPGRRAHLHRHRARGHRQRAAQPHEDRAVGRARRRRGRGRRALGAPRRRRGVADVRRGVRDDVAVEVLRRDAARRRPGARS